MQSGKCMTKRTEFNYCHGRDYRALTDRCPLRHIFVNFDGLHKGCCHELTYFHVQFIKTKIVVKWLINSMLLNFYNSFNGLNSMRPGTETIDKKYSLFESFLDFSKTSRCFLNNMNSFPTYRE